MNRKLSLKEKSEYLKANGWYNIWVDHYWLQPNVEYANPDWSGLPTLEAYNVCRQNVIKKRIKAIRKSKEMSLKDFAGRLGVTIRIARKIEKDGYLREPMIYEISRALKCSHEEILNP